MPKEIKGDFQNVLLNTRGNATGKLLVKDLFQPLPFAILKMSGKDNQRGAGILAHITSLSSHFGIGDLGPEAYVFADFLHRSGQKYWQLLPVNPVEEGQGYSPYSATSSRAGNTWLISPELLVNDGLLSQEVVTDFYLPQEEVANYEAAALVRDELFEQAWHSFNKSPATQLQQAFLKYCQTHRY